MGGFASHLFQWVLRLEGAVESPKQTISGLEALLRNLPYNRLMASYVQRAAKQEGRPHTFRKLTEAAVLEWWEDDRRDGKRRTMH